MPRGDGTGPMGAGAGTGHGMGGCGMGAGLGRKRNWGMGPGGTCICPKCKKTVPHQQGVPCGQVKCPDCGTSMTRGS